MWCWDAPVLASAVEFRRKKKEMEEDDVELPEETRLYKYLMNRYDLWNPDRVIIPVQKSYNSGCKLWTFLDFLLDYDELFYSKKIVIIFIENGTDWKQSVCIIPTRILWHFMYVVYYMSVSVHVSIV